MSQATLTPNGTAVVVGTTHLSGGATTIHGALLDEGASGTLTLDTYYEGTTVPSYVLLDMSTFTLPPGAHITNVTNYAVMSAGTASPYVYMWRYGSNGRTQVGPQSSPWVTYTTADVDYAGVYPATQNDIDTYQLYIYVEPAGVYLYVTKAWVVVTYIGLPTVGVSAPTGTKTTSATTVQWSFGKDNSSPGGQTKYQVKLFTAAQYGAGGFSPDTSTSWYDSGVVASAVASHSLTNLLSNTFRCYTRAATTNGGKDQWSPWAFSSFTVALKSLNVWRGSSFSTGPVKIWNGSAFVDAVNIKIWNGSAWINSVGG